MMKVREVGQDKASPYKIAENHIKPVYNNGAIAFRASPLMPQPGSSVGFVNRHRSQFHSLVLRNGHSGPKDGHLTRVHSSLRKVPILGAKSYSIE